MTMLGKNHSEEVRIRISKAQKGRKHKPHEGFQIGHKPYKGTERTRFKKGHSCVCPPEKHFRKHSMAGTKFYIRWQALRTRCNNKKFKQYSDYGGRGIRCEWKSFEEFRDAMYEGFLLHVEKHGESNTQLDRLDNNGNYSTKNCRWVTRSEQMRNRRNNKMISFAGRTMCQTALANELGISYSALWKRLKKYPIKTALTKENLWQTLRIRKQLSL